MPSGLANGYELLRDLGLAPVLDEPLRDHDVREAAHPVARRAPASRRSRRAGGHRPRPDVLQHRAGREHLGRGAFPWRSTTRSAKACSRPRPAWSRLASERVAGYAVLRIDPAAVAPEPTGPTTAMDAGPVAGAAPHGVVGGRRGRLRRLTHGRDRSVSLPGDRRRPGDRRPGTAAAGEREPCPRGKTRRPPLGFAAYFDRRVDEMVAFQDLRCGPEPGGRRRGAARRRRRRNWRRI